MQTQCGEWVMGGGETPNTTCLQMNLTHPESNIQHSRVEFLFQRQWTLHRDSRINEVSYLGDLLLLETTQIHFYIWEKNISVGGNRGVFLDGSDNEVFRHGFLDPLKHGSRISWRGTQPPSPSRRSILGLRTNFYPQAALLYRFYSEKMPVLKLFLWAWVKAGRQRY